MVGEEGWGISDTLYLFGERIGEDKIRWGKYLLFIGSFAGIGLQVQFLEDPKIKPVIIVYRKFGTIPYCALGTQIYPPSLFLFSKSSLAGP